MKQLLICICLVCLLPAFCTAQSGDSVTIEMRATYKGKTMVIPLASMLYTLIFPDNTATPVIKENKGKEDATPDIFYISISLKYPNRNVLRLIADRKAFFSGSIFIKKQQDGSIVQTITFDKARFNNFTTSFIVPNYSANNLSIETAVISIDGEEMKMKE